MAATRLSQRQTHIQSQSSSLETLLLSVPLKFGSRFELLALPNQSSSFLGRRIEMARSWNKHRVSIVMRLPACLTHCLGQAITCYFLSGLV